MKKITLLLVLFFNSFLSYSQWTEGFESGIPATWTVFDNGVGTAQSWGVTTLSTNVYSGTQAAEVNRENIGLGNTSEDWLVTPLQTNIATNAQLRFFSRSQLTGDTGTLYQIRLSSTTATGPTDVASYTIIQTYTELELSAVANTYEEKLVSLAAYAGENRYIAFVRVHTQVGSATSGDKWLLDEVKMTQQCFDPTVLTATNIGSQSAVLGWANPSGAPLFDVEYGLSGFTQGTGTIATSVTNPYTATNLTPNSAYQFYVRALCTSGTNSAWAGPFNFTTKPLGSVCADPIQVTSLPYQVTGDNTSNYGDDVNGQQGSLCGASPATTNYLAGDDVFYSYTATATGLISITMTPTSSTFTNSSLFVYEGCANVGVTCFAGVANSSSAPRVLNLTVTAGQTYIIVISSTSGVQTVGYDLLIQSENCVPKPTELGASNITLDSADLSWTSTGFTTWEVSVQPLGSAIPSGSGASATSNPYTATGLSAATQYQYWVRAECTPGSGIFTAWAGPFAFNTAICNPVDACLHTFKMTDAANNGWNGASMEVRQNGIVVGTIGTTYTSGAGPVSVTVPLCHNVPFDLYWSTAGSQPQQCIVSILNSFGQTIYTKAAGEGNPGQVLYANTVDCVTPRCDIAPTGLSATLITTTSATLGWDAPATTTWDIYLVPSGSPAPDATTVPTYDNVTVNPFLTTIPLLPDTTYDFYVRVECSPFPSEWSNAQSFTTLPTCPKPTGLTVSAITTTSANFGWVNGTPTDTSWEILLVPSPTATLPTMLPPANPVITPGMLLIPTSGPSPVTVNTLTPATIYFYYIRTVCSTTDSSTWAGPFKFNTVTCAPATKCNYKFVLTDTGNNGWNGARMQVLQNGILVATMGATITGSGPTTVLVGLCPDVPFELYWNITGTAPSEVGLTIQNPFTDIIYTKVAGEGEPQTVLFSSTGNCTAPTCPKPTALTVNTANSTQTTTELSWTEMGSATQWEVYVAPVGSPAPVNGTAVSGVAPYYIANSNPFTVIGLQPATTYIYYVRAICSTTDVGTWTILNPKTFTTKPLNDECDAAIPVPVNPTRDCVNSVMGNTVGGTASTPSPSPVCPGSSNDDVWFSFVATAATHIITLSDIVGSTTDLNHTLYEGTDCNALTQLYCSNPNVSVAVDLIPGNTYKIRVYTNGGNINQSAEFNICVTTPGPITNDECATAIEAPVNNGLECVVVAPGSLTGATASAASTACIGTEDDDVWYSFVATSSTHYLSLIDVVGTTNNLNHAVYSGDCTNLVQKYCSTGGSLLSNNNTFVIGETYYIRVWSNSNVLQDVTFNLCIGKVLPPITTNVTQYTKTQLIEDVLLNTTCASVSNITFSTGTNFGSTNGIGYFDQSLSEFPFQNGVILTTGNALSAPGPNSNTLSEGVTAWGGDPDLEAIILASTGQVMNGKNATKLEFDFVPLAESISFNYIFASEEYGTFQCSFSDAFAFLLTNTVTGVTTNLAIVPGTTDPVSVVKVRNQLYNGGCASVNPTYFSSFYGNNGINPIGAPINYNGVTVPMTATSAVTPGVQYHIKMVIADRGDTAYDSAVFLEGGSFNIGNVELGDDLAGENAICLGGSTTLVSGLNPTQYTFNWTLNGVPIPNETGPDLLVTQPGVYAINAQFGTSTCFATDSITVEYFQDVAPGIPNTLAICDPSGTAIFDLTQNTPVILNPYTTPHSLVYFLTQADADANTNPITNPNSFQNTSNPQTIYVRINNSTTSCFQTTSFIITAEDLTPQYTLGGEMSYCPEGGTTISVIPTNNNFNPSQVSYTWSFNGNVLVSETSSSLTISTAAGYGTYTVTVNNSGCTATQQFVISNSNTVWDFTITAPETLCPLETGTLTVNVTNNTANSPVTYTYVLPDSSTVTSSNSTLSIDETGVYTVTVAILGCTTTQSVTVGESVANWNVSFLNEPYVICQNQSVLLSFDATNFEITDPNAVYTWTAPNGDQTTGATVSANQVGNYSLEVDIFGCKTTSVVAVGENTATVAIAINEGCLGNEYRLEAVPVNGSFDPDMVTFTWSGPDFTLVPNMPNTIVLNTQGSYTVKVATPDGCFSEETITVTNTTCTIQKGISPNGDGDNESFLLTDVKKLQIYNRYGLRVYSYADYTNQWHGQTDSGSELPDGTYYYIIERGNGDTLTGWIYINR